MSTPDIIFEQLEIGPMQNFLYFIGDPASKAVGVVDPAWDAGFILDTALKKGYTITAILLTHGHSDHVNAVEPLQEKTQAQVYISKHEPDFYRPECQNLNLVADNEEIAIGSIKLTCLHTPGHTPGGQCFRYQDILITGDTLFIDGCGRCDLPGGNAQAMYNTLQEKILKLPDSVIIYPGHDYGPTTSATLGEQKQTNPYLATADRSEFLHKRMGI